MLAVDTSALVKRYVDEPGSDEVTSLMDDDPQWCASELVRCEATILLARLATSRRQADHLTRLFHADWDAFHVVPVDERCLSRGRPRSAPTSGSGSSTPSTWPPPPVYRRRCATSRSTRGRCWPPWPSTSNRCPLPRTTDRWAQAGARVWAP